MTPRHAPSDNTRPPHLHDWLDSLLHQQHANPPSGGFTPRQLGKGELLSTPSATRDQVFIVHAGRLRVYLTDTNRELTLCFLEPGEIFTTHTPTYLQAVVPSSIFVTDTTSFSHRLARDASITPVMMRVLGRILSNSVDLIADLAFREVPQRLARFLLGRVHRCGQPCDEGWLIELELSTEDIASLLGTTRQTVSSLINQWERDGLLARRGRRTLVIPAPDALSRHIGDGDAANCRPADRLG
ncbi:Crp/Fnr family transcriptional regulator [Propionivibrio limicola]|uniref:Crp/Fnr family transcriptional regulator n=1 Tax=Propionivibrio limicola TaxID=167645 RepID=UPI0012917715|nr:Crp/Fnr family transcriptional regulator [Propionivibrio limicola]